MSRVFGVGADSIAPYIRHVADSEAKAFDDDEFALGDHWVLRSGESSLVVTISMSTPVENVDTGPTTLTPVMRRLLNKPLLCKGRSTLVMSQRRRERLACKEKERDDFRAEHPWFGQIEGYQREIIRRMIYQGAGRELEAKRLEWVLFRVGDMLGKEVIWPILSHLLDGGTFHCHGMQICGVHPNVQKLPSLPFEQFLADHVAPGTRPGQLVAVEMLLKAWAVMEEEWGRSLQNQEEPAGESAAVMTPQVPSKAEG